MSASIAVVLLPSVDVARGLMMQEECCWSLTSGVNPVLPFALAGTFRAQGHDVRLEPVSVTATAAELPEAEVYGMVFSWIFGDRLLPLVAEIRKRERLAVLVANPSATLEALPAYDAALGEPYADVALLRPQEIFNRGPLPFDALGGEYWARFGGILYQLTTGCPWACPYCVWAHPCRTRDVDRAVGELCELSRRASSAKQGLGLLCNELPRTACVIGPLLEGLRGTGLAWRTDLNVRTLRREAVAAARAAGLASATLGIEFLEDEMLGTLGKGHSVEEALEAFRVLADFGVGFRFSLRRGVGETAGQVRRMLEHLAALAPVPEHVTIGPMVEWPGRSWLPSGPRRNCGTKRFPRWALVLDGELTAAWADVAMLCKERGWTR